MSGSPLASNTSLKVNRAISTTTTVNSNCYAQVTYQYSGSSVGITGLCFPITRYFGAGQSIPATISVVNGTGGTPTALTYTISSGVEFINSL